MSRTNKMLVAHYVAAILHELHRGRREEVLAAFHEVLPEDYFDDFRPTDSAVWEAARHGNSVPEKGTGTHLRAWYAACVHIRGCLPFRFETVLTETEEEFVGVSTEVSIEHFAAE